MIYKLKKKVNIKTYGRSDICIMVEWEDPFVSPLKVTASWTVKIQQSPAQYTNTSEVRGPCIQASEGGRIGMSKGGKWGKNRDRGYRQSGTSRGPSWCSSGVRVGLQPSCGSPEGRRISSNILVWVVKPAPIAAKLGDGSRDVAQQCGSCRLAAIIASRKKKP